MGKVIMIGNRKGGCGKTMTAASLGAGLVRLGYKTLLIDLDSQHSLTISLGIPEPEKLPITISTFLSNIINETDFSPTEGIIRNPDGIDIIPANNSLTNIELALVQRMFDRELVLRRYIETVKPLYDYIVLDTAPSLDMLAINALAAANSVIIPVTPKYLDTKGLELFLKTVGQIQRRLNPELVIGGILLTMVDRRENFTKQIITLVKDAYGGKIHIFDEYIPRSVRAAETSAYGGNVFTHDPRGKVAAAYTAFVEGVLNVA